MLNGRGSFGGNVFKIQLIYMKQIGRCCPGPSYALHAFDDFKCMPHEDGVTDFTYG